MVSRSEAGRVMQHIGLTLPSEIQWECAARATTSTRWWTGYDPQSLIGAENAGSGIDASLPYKDEWPELAPVDALRPNPWGLHHMLGNVAEWTSDNYWTSYRWDLALDGTGRQLAPDSGLRVVRGGSFGDDLSGLRASRRVDSPPDQPNATFGLRPLRPIDPLP